MSLTLLLLSLIVAGASCGRLEPQYLPPRQGSYSGSGAGTAAGAGAGAGAYSGSGSYSGGANIPITRYENNNDGNGNYNYNYETGNGISAHESGSPRASGPEGPAVTAEGGYSYRAPDGQQISLSYTADEHGFHPVGSHIPTPPPIPDAILKSIEFNRRNPSSEGAYNPGSYGDSGTTGGASSGGYHY